MQHVVTHLIRKKMSRKSQEEEDLLRNVSAGGHGHGFISKMLVYIHELISYRVEL